MTIGLESVTQWRLHFLYVLGPTVNQEYLCCLKVRESYTTSQRKWNHNYLRDQLVCNCGMEAG